MGQTKRNILPSLVSSIHNFSFITFEIFKPSMFPLLEKLNTSQDLVQPTIEALVCLLIDATKSSVSTYIHVHNIVSTKPKL